MACGLGLRSRLAVSASGYGIRFGSGRLAPGPASGLGGSGSGTSVFRVRACLRARPRPWGIGALIQEIYGCPRVPPRLNPSIAVALVVAPACRVARTPAVVFLQPHVWTCSSRHPPPIRISASSFNFYAGIEFLCLATPTYPIMASVT